MGTPETSTTSIDMEGQGEDQELVLIIYNSSKTQFSRGTLNKVMTFLKLDNNLSRYKT